MLKLMFDLKNIGRFYDAHVLRLSVIDRLLQQTSHPGMF